MKEASTTRCTRALCTSAASFARSRTALHRVVEAFEFFQALPQNTIIGSPNMRRSKAEEFGRLAGPIVMASINALAEVNVVLTLAQMRTFMDSFERRIVEIIANNGNGNGDGGS